LAKNIEAKGFSFSVLYKTRRHVKYIDRSDKELYGHIENMRECLKTCPKPDAKTLKDVSCTSQCVTEMLKQTETFLEQSKEHIKKQFAYY